MHMIVLQASCHNPIVWHSGHPLHPTMISSRSYLTQLCLFRVLLLLLVLLISSTPNISSSNRGDDGRLLLEDDLFFFCNDSGGNLSVEALLLLSVDSILVVYIAVQREDIEVAIY